MTINCNIFCLSKENNPPRDDVLFGHRDELCLGHLASNYEEYSSHKSYLQSKLSFPDFFPLTRSVDCKEKKIRSSWFEAFFFCRTGLVVSKNTFY